MTALYTNSFNVANQTGLAPDFTVGGGGSSSLNIASNQAVIPSAGVVAISVNTSVVYPTGHYAKCTVGTTVSTTQDEGVGPMVCASTSAQTGYFLQAGGDFRLYKVVAGAFTQLGSTLASQAVAGDALETRHSGTTITVLRNGTAICGTPLTDSSIASGSAGLFASSTGSLVNVDNFEGGDFSVPSAADTRINNQFAPPVLGPRGLPGPFAQSLFRQLRPGILPSAALAGAAALTFGQTGALTGAGALSGTAALTIGQTGALTTAGALAGTAALVFGQSGTLLQPGLAGTAAMVLGASGTLAGAGALAGVSAITVSQTAALAAAGALAGSSALVIAQTAALGASGALAGTSALTFGASGTASQPAGALSGTASLTFSQAGTLTGFAALIGSCQIVISQSGTLINANTAGQISGTASLTFAASGTLTGLGVARPQVQLRGSDYGMHREIHEDRYPDFEQDPDTTLDYPFGWAPDLEGDTIATSIFLLPDGMTQVSASQTDTTTVVFLSGPIRGRLHRCTNRITTVGGRTFDKTIRILGRQQ